MSDDAKRKILSKRAKYYDPVARLYDGIKKLRPDVDDKLAMNIAKTTYDVSKKYNLDPRDLIAQIRTESGFRPNAVSEAGARGIAQLMPLTYKTYGVDPNNIEQSIDAMGNYMRKNIDSNVKKYGSDDISLAHMRYHAGPNHLNRYMTQAGNDPSKISAPRTRAYPNKIQNYRQEAYGDWQGSVDPQAPLEFDDYSSPRSSVSVANNYNVGKPLSPFDYANIKPADKVSFNNSDVIAERVKELNDRYKENGWHSLSREEKDFFKANWKNVLRAQNGSYISNKDNFNWTLSNNEPPTVTSSVIQPTMRKVDWATRKMEKHLPTQIKKSNAYENAYDNSPARFEREYGNTEFNIDDYPSYVEKYGFVAGIPDLKGVPYKVNKDLDGTSLNVVPEYSDPTVLILAPTQLEISPRQLSNMQVPLDMALTHETSHSRQYPIQNIEQYRAIYNRSLGPTLRDSELNKLDKDIRSIINKEDINIADMFQLDKTLAKKVDHDRTPTEVRADIQAIRRRLTEENIYNDLQEKAGGIRQEHLDKLSPQVKKSMIYQRLMKNFDKKDLLHLMNWITDNNNNEGYDSYAKEGGNVGSYTAEIEGGEYVFNPEGVTNNTFKMLDPSGKDHISPVGFLAKGKDHAKDDSGGIKVAEGNAYIGSKYLGIDGNKSSNKNPSVASLLIKNGGNVLGRGFQKSYDKYGINKWNPGAMKHHVNMMKDISRDAELAKIKKSIEEYETDMFKVGGMLNKLNVPRRYRKYEDGGITDEMSFNTAFGTARKSGMKVFEWRGKSYGTKLKSEVNNSPRSDSKARKTPIYTLPEVVVTAPRMSSQKASNEFVGPPDSYKSDYDVIVENQLRAIRRDDKGNPLTSKKDYMILHQTGTPDLNNYMRKTDRAGAHYYIGKDGKIYQTAPEEYIAMHAGKGRIGDNFDPNAIALGIEFVGAQTENGYEDLTDAQTKTGSSFIADWVIRNNIKTEDIPSRIFGHHDITVFDRVNGKTVGYKDPQSLVVRQDADGPTVQFGQRYYGMARKPDFDRPTKEKMLNAVKDQVIRKRGYEEGGFMFDPMTMSYDINRDIYREGGDFNGSISWLPGSSNIVFKPSKLKVKSTKFPRYKADRPRMRASKPTFGKISVKGFRKPRTTKKTASTK